MINVLPFQGQFLECVALESLKDKLFIDPLQTQLQVGVSHPPSSVVLEDIVPSI